MSLQEIKKILKRAEAKFHYESLKCPRKRMEQSLSVRVAEDRYVRCCDHERYDKDKWVTGLCMLDACPLVHG